MAGALDTYKGVMLQSFADQLANSPDGSYTINVPEVLIPKTQVSRVFSWLMSELVFRYPQFQFVELTSIDPAYRNYITVEWHRR